MLAPRDRSRIAAPAVSARTLYAAADGRAVRPGEPVRVRLIELAAGSRWPGPPSENHREWLVLEGSVQLGGTLLQLRDYHVAPARTPAAEVRSDEGALVFLRESVAPGS